MPIVLWSDEGCDLRWNILEEVVILHETVHELQRKNQSGLIFKIEFEKADDKVQ